MSKNLEVILTAPDDRYKTVVSNVFTNTFPTRKITLILSQKGIDPKYHGNPSMENPTGRAILRQITAEGLYPHAQYIVSIDKGKTEKYLFRDHLTIKIPSTSLIVADLDHKNTFTLGVDWPFFRRRVRKNLSFALDYLKEVTS